MNRAVVIIALLAAPAFADDVYLRGGGQITGVIIEETEESVTVDIGGATLSARMSSVVRIERNISPLQEYRGRAAELAADDVEGWRELARWARGEMLSSQAREAFARVLAVAPDDEEANRALGRVLVDGAWISEEDSYRARGYIEFEGEWMTPGERSAILAERAAEEESARRENEAAIRAIEAEQAADRERQAREAADRAARFNNLPQLGDPIPWAWGLGPGYWPTPSQLPAPTSGGR